MKRVNKVITTLLLSILLFACDKTSNEVETVSPGDYPLNAQILSFDDLPGWEKVTVYDNDNNIKSQGDYYNGLKQGPWTEYDNRGIITSLTTYNAGKLHGVNLVFERGNLQSKAYYVNGVLNGQYLIYKSRRVVEKRNYASGVLEGIVYKYYTNGKILQEAAYKNNLLNGIAKWYDQEGNLTIAYEYKNGELINENALSTESEDD